MRNRIDFRQSAADIFQSRWAVCGGSTRIACESTCLSLKDSMSGCYSIFSWCAYWYERKEHVVGKASATCAWRQRCDWLHAYAAVQTHLTTCRTSTRSRETTATGANSTGSRFEIAGLAHISILIETAVCCAEFPREYESNSLLALVVFRGVQSEWDLFKVSSDPC